MGLHDIAVAAPNYIWCEAGPLTPRELYANEEISDLFVELYARTTEMENLVDVGKLNGLTLIA